MITSQGLLATALDYSRRVTVTPALKETLERTKSLPLQNFFVYHQTLDRFDFKDMARAFDLIDTLELLITHSMNSHLLHNALADKDFLDQGLNQLADLQHCHGALAKACWINKIPIWSYDNRDVLKIDGKLHYSTEQESQSNIDLLWRSMVSRFSSGGDEEVEKFMKSYTFHSWLAKAISRPKGRYLVKKIIANTEKYRKVIGIKSGNKFEVKYPIRKDCFYKEEKNKSFFKRYTPGMFDAISLSIPECEDYNTYISELLFPTIVDMQVKLYYSPTILGFLHELQHIKTGLKNISRVLFPMDAISAEHWTDQEEWYTIRESATCENVMNEEYQLPARVTHHGYSIDELKQFSIRAKTLSTKNLHNNIYLMETLLPPHPPLSI